MVAEGTGMAQTTTVPVRCPEIGSNGLQCTHDVPVDKSRYDDSDHIELVNVRCPDGHTFDVKKSDCPRCGKPLEPGGWRKPQASFGKPPSADLPKQFYPARCSNTKCDYEGSKTLH